MFADRLKYLRKSRELNQVQLAQRLGVAKQSISNWENDNIAPSVEMLVKIADFFDVRVDYLLDRDIAEGQSGQSIDVTGLTSKQIKHIKLIVEDFRGK